MSDLTSESEETVDVELENLQGLSTMDILEAAEASASISENEEVEPTAKPARKAARKSPRKSTRKTTKVEEKKDPVVLEDLSVADLRTSSIAHSDENFVLVVNTNPYPVTANMRGQALPGYSRGVVSSDDPVSRRAIERGKLLVPSDQ